MNKNILETIYPLTIVSDRYSGVYSKGVFTAWNLEPSEVPTDISGDDMDCMNFWRKNTIICGKGSTVEEAVGNLYIELCRKKIW